MAIQRIEQEAKLKQDLSSSLEKLSLITSESLVRTEELGALLNFQQGRLVFERTLKLFRDLQQVSLDNVPFGVLNNLKNRADAAISQFKQIQDFNPGTIANAAPARDNLIQAISQEYDQHYQIITPVLSYAIRKGTDFEGIERAARKELESIKRSSQEQNIQAEKHLTDIMDTLEKVRQAAAEVGVAQHAVHFEDQAKEHLKNSKKWIIITAVLGLIALSFGIASIFILTARLSTMTSVQSIQLVIAKLIIFSILYSATLWSARIYKAQWHNYVINKHRHNALKTFETFVKAASDTQTKDTVLLQATRSIFSCQPSGFISPSDVPEGPQILEIIRGFTNIRPAQ